MSINKFESRGWPLTFQPRSLLLESHQYIQTVFSETRPIELKFHMKTPFDRLAKIYTYCFGHMTKMATMSRVQRSGIDTIKYHI